MIIGTSKPTGNTEVAIGGAFIAVKSMDSEGLISRLMSDDGSLRLFAIALPQEVLSSLSVRALTYLGYAIVVNKFSRCVHTELIPQIALNREKRLDINIQRRSDLLH